MRSVIRVLMASSVAMASGVSLAADVVIDNQNIPGNDIQSISISPTTGNIFITTIEGYTVSKEGGGSGPAVSIGTFVATPSQIEPGTHTTVSWTTTNASSCQPTQGSTSWLNKTITPLGSGSTSVGFAKAGVFTLELTCFDSGGGSTSKTTQVVVGTPPPVSISSFTATPSTIEAGQATTLAWNTSNAVSCLATGGVSGWTGLNLPVPSGNLQVPIANTGSYTFGLSCADAGAGTATASQAVQVNAAQVTNCPSSPLAGTSQPWLDFWLVNFPMPAYDNRFLAIPRTGYAALKFNTGNVVDNGKLTTIETTQTAGVRLGAISECPGIFDVPSECKYSWGISGGLRWATDGRSGACQLDSNKDYYFNVTFTNGSTTGSTTCSESPCITQVQHTNN